MTAAGRLVVRRAWPRGDELVLELIDPAGLVVPGRRGAGGRIETYEPGTDPRLVGLAGVVRRAGGPRHVVGHRLGRRAVVHDGRRWTKVVRRAKLPAVVERHRLVRAVTTGGALRVAEVVAVDERLGALVLDHVDGVEMLEHPDPAVAAERVRTALYEWWRRPPPAALPLHDAAAECAVLDGWASAASRHDVIPPAYRPAFAAAVESAANALASLEARPVVLGHRDLHDGQLLVGDEHVGVLDLDTAARSDPALDLGNLLAHVDLAAALGRIDATTAGAVDAVLRGALDDTDDRGAVETYRAAARARLVAVHAFRPSTRPGALALLRLAPAVVGQPSARKR